MTLTNWLAIIAGSFCSFPIYTVQIAKNVSCWFGVVLELGNHRSSQQTIYMAEFLELKMNESQAEETQQQQQAMSHS